MCWKEDLSVTKLGINLNFSKPLSDGISVTGLLPIEANYNPTGKKIVVNVGGVVKTFTLTSKASAKVGGDLIKISIKASKKVVLAQQAKFGVKFSKGSFSTSLSDEGLTNADIAAARSVVVSIIFENSLYQTTKQVLYTAKTGKTGKAK